MLYPKEKIDKLRQRWETPKGKKLVEKIKKTRCYLSPVIFREVVKNFPHINDPEIEDKVDLRGINLSGFDFRSPISETEDYIEEMVVLSNIHFEGAKLRYCNFQNGSVSECHFEHAELDHTSFKSTTISNSFFQNANCNKLNLIGCHILNCNFKEANIKDVLLNQAIADQKTQFGETLKSEKEGHHHLASIEYKKLKLLFKNSGLHYIGDKFHVKEMRSRRTIEKSTTKKFLSYVFGDLLCEYGTSYSRILLWSFIVIAICALIFLKPYGMAFHGEAIAQPNIFETLYFSIVSFTTLGYGDFSATGAMRFVAATEALLGTTLMALFTVIAARSIIRD